MNLAGLSTPPHLAALPTLHQTSGDTEEQTSAENHEHFQVRRYRKPGPPQGSLQVDKESAVEPGQEEWVTREQPCWCGSPAGTLCL